MKCMRSGYCCVESEAVILDYEGCALRMKRTGMRCPHLSQDKNHVHSCAIHSKWWYPSTPCASSNTIFGETKNCNMGTGIMIENDISTVAELIRDESRNTKMKDLKVLKQYGSEAELICMLTINMEMKGFDLLPNVENFINRKSHA